MVDQPKRHDPESEVLILKACNLKEDILRHIQFTLGRDPYSPDKYAVFMGLSYSVRDRLVSRWLNTQRAYYDTLAKRVYYLSMEFLPGRFLMNYIISLKMENEVKDVLAEFGYDLDEIEEEEWDAGLGNGGLGRLASCYMDSLATLKLPGYGYGILYDYGIFHQTVINGYQRETCDNWLRHGSPWEIRRPHHLYPIRFYGRTETYEDHDGITRHRWVGGDNILAMACDIMVPGFGDQYVTNMRLWAAKSSREFNLDEFNQGDYIGAVEGKVMGENISKVLYPSDEKEEGKELRLKQQYFFVAATLCDIIRRFKKMNRSFSELSDFVAIQLNDTHPSIAIPELMRILMDEEVLEWEFAWDICGKTFAYTNHTVLPEALETWSVDLIKRLLPRHLEIIFEINRRFLSDVEKTYGKKSDAVAKMSLFQEGDVKKVRMANLAVVGSHVVNGVAALHSNILKKNLFKEFDQYFKNRIRSVTNGITPRRWLYQANPLLSRLITSVIGSEWITDLGKLKDLIPLADDSRFRAAWIETKTENKKRLARYILRKVGLSVNPNTLFDIHVKRIHEYKRQLLNVLHVITLYNRIKNDPDSIETARTILFSGKAAPAYHQAKLIIKLINSVADIVNVDPDVKGLLKVVFLPNYCISQAEKIIPAADLSEQISTAGMEASGTGNMKLALNGAMTIGTLDGANVEIMEEVGKENVFIFGLTSAQVSEYRRRGYNPEEYYSKNAELKKALDMISSGFFSPDETGLFFPIIDSLRHKGDYYFVLADYQSYIETQEEVSRLFTDSEDWTRRSILNTANMGKFSSDRAVLEYAEDIWNIKPLQM